MFNLGELRDILEIHKVTKKYHNGTGISTNELQKLYKLRCKKKIQSSKEFLSADRGTESQIIKFVVFSRRDIHLDNVVIYRGEKYDIKHISPFGNGYVELVCEVKR